MSTALKSFRLPISFVNFLKKKSKELGVSQAKIVETSLEKMIKEDNQWQRDLAAIAMDKKYQKEQIALAEENYED